MIFSVTAYSDASASAEASLAPGLRWKRVSIPITFSNSLLKPNPALRPDSDIQGAIRRSLDAWETAANIEFQVNWSDKLSVSPAGNAGDGTSLVTIAQTPENLLIFGGDAADVSARTRVFFNRRNEISEADVVLNPYQQFSTDGAPGTFDFESTLTHEIGHLLGLEHSTVLGATMSEQQGKNGTFNLSNFSARTLSEDDVSQIRAIYGAKDDADCCGALDGKISLANLKSAKSFKVWLEEAETGRVAAGGRLGTDGSFIFKGLRPGGYLLYAQDGAGNFSGQFLGDVEIAKGKTSSVLRKITPAAKDFDVQFTGLNGQLSKLALPLSGGKTYQIYIGGKNLSPEDFKIGATSPYISVSSGNATKYDYGREVSVFSVEIRSLPETPAGEYTLYLQKSDGRIEFLNGRLAVEKIAGPGNPASFE
ncbi:MAG TPA: matrixin family metalloprotease [Pyrinomonadaceae bacterium]